MSDRDCRHCKNYVYNSMVDNFVCCKWDCKFEPDEGEEEDGRTQDVRKDNN